MGSRSDSFRKLSFGIRAVKKAKTDSRTLSQKPSDFPSSLGSSSSGQTCSTDLAAESFPSSQKSMKLLPEQNLVNDSTIGDGERNEVDCIAGVTGIELDASLVEPATIRLYSEAQPSVEIFSPMKSKKKRRIKDSATLAQIDQEEINRIRNQADIHVFGTDICGPIREFDDLRSRYHVHPQILENVGIIGYVRPTPIQMQAIPLLLEKRELLASAPTGSGKTAAFIIPLLHALQLQKETGYRAVIVSPTRELAKQTYFEVGRLGAKTAVHAHLLGNVANTIKALSKKTKSAKKFGILITTPNRLVSLLQTEPLLLDLSSVEWLIIDESDKLFEADKKGGFRDQLAVIYKACSNPAVRRALFSATFAFEVEEWCKANLDNVVMVSIGSRNAATKTVDQKLVFVGNSSGKLSALRQIMREEFIPPVLVFVQTRQNAKELFRELALDGNHVDVIHSDRDEKERDEIVSNFRAGKTWILIATEVMGRGIDFKGVNLVVNYDFPLTSISYIHRIGRTGRAGQRGKAVTFFTEKDSVYLRSIAHVMKRSGCEVPEYMLELPKPSKSRKDKLTKRRGNGKLIGSSNSAKSGSTKKRIAQNNKLKKLKRLSGRKKSAA